MIGIIAKNSAAAQEVASTPFGVPSINYLKEFAGNQGRVFVYERFDASGSLTERSVEKLATPVQIDGAIDRTFGSHKVKLRGLMACPKPTVTYNLTETWDCTDAASDYAGAIYNNRASVILCKTLVLRSDEGQRDPASCFALVGGSNGEAAKVVNDDDGMVYLGLAEISMDSQGRTKRPDLEETQNLSRSMGFQDAK